MAKPIIESAEYPVLALRGLVAFPDMMMTVDVGRNKSVAALNTAMDNNLPIYLVTQKDITVESPQADDLYKTGCVCRAVCGGKLWRSGPVITLFWDTAFSNSG